MHRQECLCYPKQIPRFACRRQARDDKQDWRVCDERRRAMYLALHTPKSRSLRSGRDDRKGEGRALGRRCKRREVPPLRSAARQNAACKKQPRYSGRDDRFRSRANRRVKARPYAKTKATPTADSSLRLPMTGRLGMTSRIGAWAMDARRHDVPAATQNLRHRAPYTPKSRSLPA